MSLMVRCRAKRGLEPRADREATLPHVCGEAQGSFRLDEHLFFWLTQVIGRRNRALAAQLKPTGVTIQQWRVLAVLNERPGCTMGALAELTSVDRTTLTRTLDTMERQRLVARRAASHDRRSVALELTEKGEVALARILPAVIEQNERALAGFPPEATRRLRADLERMFDNLKEEGGGDT